jgi:hypothetical protein
MRRFNCHSAGSQQARVGLLFFFSVFAFFLSPYFVWRIRHDRVGDAFDQVAFRDSEQLDQMRTFRDLGWEVWTKVHDHMRDEALSYTIYTTLVYFINFCLWYAWYGIRVWRDLQVVLSVTLCLLATMSLVLNSVSQFPPPPGFIQFEPKVASYFLGLVTHNGHGMLSSRAAFSFVCMHDWLQYMWPDKSYTRKFVVLAYCVVVMGYLWATHQMYTSSLVLNVMAALAAYLSAVSMASGWQKTVYHMLSPDGSRSLVVGPGGGFRHAGGMFSVDDDEPEEEDEEEFAGTQEAQAGHKLSDTLRLVTVAHALNGAVETQ